MHLLLSQGQALRIVVLLLNQTCPEGSGSLPEHRDLARVSPSNQAAQGSGPIPNKHHRAERSEEGKAVIAECLFSNHRRDISLSCQSSPHKASSSLLWVLRLQEAARPRHGWACQQHPAGASLPSQVSGAASRCLQPATGLASVVALDAAGTPCRGEVWCNQNCQPG